MEKMPYITSDTGRPRRTAVEIFKIESNFLASSTTMMLPATYRLGSEETLEEAIKIITKEVTSNKATTEVTTAVIGKIVDQGFRDHMCLPRK
jgi:hypothetical protein